MVMLQWLIIQILIMARTIKNDENYFEESKNQLETQPFHMNINEEFRHQLSKNAIHNEDIRYQIIDDIFI